eukprot:3806089-Alexandrium_andersonii.AAC.1
MPMAALLSLRTCSRTVSPRSWATATMPRPSAAPLTMPASSASPELRAMVLRVADQCSVYAGRARAPLLRWNAG